MKKLAFLMLLLGLSFALLSCSPFDTQATTTSAPIVDEIVYDITTVAELKAIQMDKNYRLMANLDLSGEIWVPLGAYATPYRGTFDGNGYSLSNLNLTTQKDGFVGLFSIVLGNVKDLTLVNPSVQIAYDGLLYVGSLAGYVSGNLEHITIENSVIQVQNTKSNSFVGGLVGFMTAKIASNMTATQFLANHIKNTSVESTITVTGQQFVYVGGAVGKLYNTKVDGLRVKSSIQATTETVRLFAGGAIGHNYSGILQPFKEQVEHADILLSNLVVETVIHAKSEDSYAIVGGLLGYNNAGVITESIAKGTLHSTGEQLYFGGLIGEDWQGKYRFSLADVSFGTLSSSETIHLNLLIANTREGITTEHLYYQVQGSQTLPIGTPVDLTLVELSLFFRDSLQWDEAFQTWVFELYPTE